MFQSMQYLSYVFVILSSVQIHTAILDITFFEVFRNGQNLLEFYCTLCIWLRCKSEHVALYIICELFMYTIANDSWVVPYFECCDHLRWRQFMNGDQQWKKTISMTKCVATKTQTKCDDDHVSFYQYFARGPWFHHPYKIVWIHNILEQISKPIPSMFVHISMYFPWWFQI